MLDPEGSYNILEKRFETLGDILDAASPGSEHSNMVRTECMKEVYNLICHLYYMEKALSDMPTPINTLWRPADKPFSDNASKVYSQWKSWRVFRRNMVCTALVAVPTIQKETLERIVKERPPQPLDPSFLKKVDFSFS